MMTKKEKNTGITLIALVITIVIMLLLAGVALQIAMGENGLISKSVQAQKEQAKAELYETAKLSYATLNAKALENGQPSPQVELALSTTQFRDRYDILGDDITDKNGNVIDTKANVLNSIKGGTSGSTVQGASGESEISMKGEYVEKPWPKKVAGVTILEEDKDKMILKLKVKKNIQVEFGEGDPYLRTANPIEIDYGTGEKGQINDLFTGVRKEYNPGEYIIKIKNISDFSIRRNQYYEIEILQWGKILEKNENNYIRIPNVSKVYEPEPDKIPIRYVESEFTEIPEWLFSKKVTSTNMSEFYKNDKLTTIPENLFKHNVNVTNFVGTFFVCKGLTTIPEELFKHNVNVRIFENTFTGCTGLTTIPEGIFKYNVNVIEFRKTFGGCVGLISIPENLFKHNNLWETNFIGTFDGCTGLTTIPENLFKYNVKTRNMAYVFQNCTGLISIPENLFKYNVDVLQFLGSFEGCKGLTSIPEGLFKHNLNLRVFSNTFEGCKGLMSIPENLFKNNVNARDFGSTFEECTGLATIPENLFKHNVNVGNFGNTFKGCNRLMNIPEKIIEFAKQVKDTGGESFRMFRGCTSASNYSSIPGYMK